METRKFSVTSVLIILLIALYLISFKDIMTYLASERTLLQGDDMGGFLRHIALLSKYWAFKPIEAHQDQPFPSLINIIGALVYFTTDNILLAYLITITILIILGSLGLNELLLLYGLPTKARLIGVIIYLFNPAIASMLFTGEIHIATTYYTMPAELAFIFC